MNRALDLARKLFGDAGGGPAEPRKLLQACWVRLIVVVPFVLLPAAIDHLHFGIRSGRSAAYWLALAWFSQVAIIAIANLAAVALGATRPRALRALTFISLTAEIVSNQLSTTAIGNLASHAVAFLFCMVAIYRVFLDRALAVWAALAGAALFVTSVSLEVSGIVPIAPYATSPLQHPAYQQASASALLCVSILGALAFTFAAANHTMNEATRLHRYITESVLRRYLPPALVERAARGELRLDAPHERLVVTTLFVAREDFSTLSKRLGPDAFARFLNQHLSEIVDRAHALGATIDKFVGDNVMIVFGVPEPMEPAEQARRAAALARAIASSPFEADGQRLACRIGINTGEAVAGHFGTLVRSDFTVVGPAVNVAARLEAACEPGRILIGEPTAQLLDEETQLEPAGELRLKGVGKPTPAFYLGLPESTEREETPT